MKLNKKGFTLVELLAVVVILLAITVMAVSSISAAIERNKAKQDKAKLEILASYAKLYLDENGKSCNDIDIAKLRDKFSLNDEDFTKVTDNKKSFTIEEICNEYNNN